MYYSDDNIIVAIAVVLVILIIFYIFSRCRRTSWYRRKLRWGNAYCASCNDFKSGFSGKEGCACNRRY